MELLYDAVCELRDKTDEFLNNIDIAIVTDQMVDNYREGIEYDFSEYGFDSSVAQQIWATAMSPYNFYVEYAVNEILHNCINIQTDGQLERYLSHSIARFKQIKARVDHKLYVEKTLTVYDYISTIPHQGSPTVFTRERGATKVEQIFDFVQCFSGMIQNVIDLMNEKLPNKCNGAALPTKKANDLKAQFKNPVVYEMVIQKLVSNGNISKDASGNLIFIKAHRAGTKYGVEALRLACDQMDYLYSQGNYTNSQIIDIHKNTFKDFDLDTRTLNNRGGISDALSYFLTILS